MFHNWLLSHKSVFTPHIADDFIARNCAHHRPIEISTILSKSQGSATGISENIHNTLWEKSRYANFSTIWPDQVLCMLSAGWEDFYVENTLHTFQNSRPYKQSSMLLAMVQCQWIHICWNWYFACAFCILRGGWEGHFLQEPSIIHSIYAQ